MKWTVAWAEIASQNVILKVVISVLSGATAILSVALVQVAMKDPIVVERSSVSKLLPKVSTERTESETKAFVEEALRQRFDSDGILIPGWLSSSEERLRGQEMENVKNSGLRQKIIVNEIKIEKDRITADVDRVMTAGPVRSAFPFPLIVRLSTVSRIPGNPYGLQLVNISQTKP